MDLSFNLAPIYRDLKDPTSRQNFEDTPDPDTASYRASQPGASLQAGKILIQVSSVSMSAGSQSRMMTILFKNGWREKSVWTIFYFLF